MSAPTEPLLERLELEARLWTGTGPHGLDECGELLREAAREIQRLTPQADPPASPGGPQEQTDDDELELRAIEQRVFTLREQWTRESLSQPDPIPNSDHDCGMLSAVLAILDTFIGGDAESDAWKAKRDDERAESRLLFAIQLAPRPETEETR